MKLRWDWYLGANTELTQQLQFRDYESDFVRQTGAYNYMWQRRGTINLAPRAPLMVDGELYPMQRDAKNIASSMRKSKCFSTLPIFNIRGIGAR